MKLTPHAVWVLCTTGLLLARPAWGAPDPPIDQIYPQARLIFPQADRFAPLGGEPPHAEVFQGGRRIGILYRTIDILPIPAYSGKPLNILVGLDLEGRITGLRIVYHEEPILAVGVSEADLAAYIHQYQGKSAYDRVRIGAYRPGYVGIDGISGATITSMVANASVMRSARKVAAALGLGPGTANRARPEREAAIWALVWGQRKVKIALLAAGLLVLSAILIFQDWLARRPRLLSRLRRGYLVYTVVFIGGFALAQLSVVNVLTFIHAVIHGFRWETFLAEPLLFLLWSFVAVTLLLWGRGVYCGWLCPFGALQELLFQGARRLRLPAFEFPQMVHERLWALKYIILLGLFGLSLQSLPKAQVAAEVEPFKTAIVMRFDREWPFVLYAGALLGMAVFNRKFFCRYLCALGAALTYPAKFRIFEWLRRRKECGRPCQICANECEVRAIHPTGEINANECHYCLDCQVTYWNAYKCPPLVERRRRRERARGLPVSPPKPAAPAGDRP